MYVVNKFIGENMIYDIANLKVEIKNENGRTEKQAIPYLAQNQDEKNIDITIDVDEKRVLQAKRTSGTCAGRLGIYAYRLGFLYWTY